jgi:hypothetical protein
MRYIIYDNINEKDFIEIKSRLDSIERISSPLLQQSGFYLNRKQYEDVLNLDYVHDGKEFMGNLGVAYDEEESSPDRNLFKFYVLKAYDDNGQRFYKKTSLDGRYSLAEVEEIFISLFEECISLYNSLEKKDLNDSIILRKL